MSFRNVGKNSVSLT